MSMCNDGGEPSLTKMGMAERCAARVTGLARLPDIVADDPGLFHCYVASPSSIFQLRGMVYAALSNSPHPHLNSISGAKTQNHLVTEPRQRGMVGVRTLRASPAMDHPH